MNRRFRWDFWAGITLLSIAVFGLFLIYPLFSLFVSAFQDAATGSWSLANFAHFFERKYYYQSMINSFSVCTFLVSPTVFPSMLGRAALQ